MNPGQMYDPPIHFEGRSATEREVDGSGMTLYYGFHESPFGTYLLALTRHGNDHSQDNSKGCFS